MAAVLTVAAGASAEPTAADKETARSLMAEGRADRERGDLHAAVKSFAAADAIMHVPTTGLELARAQEMIGLLVEARETALRVVRSPAGADDPVPFVRAREAASALSQKLESRIPSITVTVAGAPKAAPVSVLLDDSPLPRELLGQPRKLDPGHHVIVASAGKEEQKIEIDVAEGDAEPVAFELAGQGTVSPAQDSTDAPPPPERSAASGAMLYGGFGLAAAASVAGTITGLLSLSKVNSIRGSGSCNGDVCSSAVQDDITWAKSMATVSTISFVAAGVGAVAGVIGVLTGAPSVPRRDRHPKSDDQARIEPIEAWVGIASLGLRGGF
jgi:hypothetical protein